MTTEIPLTQDLVALVDDEDAAAVLAHKWCADRKRRTFYAKRNVRRPDGTKRLLGLHTFLTGWPMVDHINGNGLDNRRANLRPATNAENQRNVGLRSNNTSGFKGVAFRKDTGRWQAQISLDGHRRYLGHYATPEDAAHAYDAASRELHGAFASLNFPKEA